MKGSNATRDNKVSNAVKHPIVQDVVCRISVVVESADSPTKTRESGGPTTTTRKNLEGELGKLLAGVFGERYAERKWIFARFGAKGVVEYTALIGTEGATQTKTMNNIICGGGGAY